MCCFLCIRRVYRAFTTHLYCAAYYTASLLLYRFGFPAHLSVRMNYIQSFDCIEITKRFLLYASTATNTLSLDVHSYSYTIGVQISICFLFLHCYLCVRYSHNNICAIESMERRRCVSQPSFVQSSQMYNDTLCYRHTNQNSLLFSQPLLVYRPNTHSSLYY